MAVGPRATLATRASGSSDFWCLAASAAAAAVRICGSQEENSSDFWCLATAAAASWSRLAFLVIPAPCLQSQFAGPTYCQPQNQH